MKKWILLNPYFYWVYLRMRGITIPEMLLWIVVWTGVGILLGAKLL
jgi:hypothetical protein